jgi:SagB-type dehydrogenase family enzyme
MSKKIFVLTAGVFILATLLIGIFLQLNRQQLTTAVVHGERIELPEPVYESSTSLEEALLQRRSIRAYRAEGLSLTEVSQLLWAAQGMTHPSGYRTAPSAGALYPLEVYLVVGRLEGLSAGVYQYLPAEHAMVQTLEGDIRASLANASLGQSVIEDAPVSLVLTAVFERTTQKYGQRGERYVYMETGSAAQNVYLQAESLGLGTVFIGAFQDERVRQVIGISEDETPVCILPVGRK